MLRRATADLAQVGAVWERAATTDPFFAVLSDPELRGGGWDSERFFATGDEEVSRVLAYLGRRGIEVPLDGTALDFGCGLGRLTGPLAQRFDGAVGVDVSATMLAKAQHIHGDTDQLEFVHNERDDLGVFTDGQFTFVYSNIVLQHLPPHLARKYIREFFRVTRPGGTIVFQLPEGRRLGVIGRVRHLVRLRTRLAALRRPAASRDSADAVEWEMHGTPERVVRAWVQSGGQAVRDVVFTNATDPKFNGQLEYLTKAPARGWVSKQYAVVKTTPRPYVEA